MKELLSVVHHAFQEARECLQNDYIWVKERWRKNHHPIELVKRIFERGTHVNNIRNLEEYEPTDRMLNTAENPRQRLYQKSAALLEDMERIFEGNEDALEEVLQKTAITPDDKGTLLELFLFNFISTIEDETDEGFSLNTIESGSQKAASPASGKKRNPSITIPQQVFRTFHSTLIQKKIQTVGTLQTGESRDKVQ